MQKERDEVCARVLSAFHQKNLIHFHIFTLIFITGAIRFVCCYHFTSRDARHSQSQWFEMFEAVTVDVARSGPAYGVAFQQK